MSFAGWGMVVYWEYAFAENFLLDGLLLYLALRCARTSVRPLNLLLAAALGGAEGVLLPLVAFPAWCVYPVKLLGGAVLVVTAVHKGSPKGYLVACAAFFFFTFALGGMLTALYSFFGVEYVEGQGYLVEGAPVALIFTGAGIFTVLCARAIAFFYRYRKLKTGLYPCELEAGGRRLRRTAFADSGNCLSFRGEPVCVLSAASLIALFGAQPKETGRITVTTVNGSRVSPVFLCERMTVNGRSYDGVYVTMGEIRTKEYQMILHTAFLEGERENTHSVKNVAAKDKGK